MILILLAIKKDPIVWKRKTQSKRKRKSKRLNRKKKHDRIKADKDKDGYR